MTQRDKVHPFLAYLLPRLSDILFCGVCFAIVLGGPKLFSYDGDLGRHITLGNYMLDNLAFPRADVFSHTRDGALLVLHEWLADVIFALAHRWIGLDGPVLIAALLAAFTIRLVYVEMLQRGTYRLVAVFVAALVTVVASVHWLARPHMFTFLLITVWTYWLERFYTKDEKSVWRFPVLMLVWANLHGAFFAGFVVWGTYVADWLFEYWHGRKDRQVGWRLAVIGLSSFAVTFINPYGWRLWTTTVGYIGNDYMTSRIVDHLSPDFHEKDMWPFLLMIVIALLALTQGRKLQLRAALLLAGWTAMGLHTVRNLPLFAVVNGPIYGWLIQNWAGSLPILQKQENTLKETESRLRGQVWIWVAILLMFFAFWSNIPLDQKGTGNIYLPEVMPVQAIDWLEQNPQTGNMFNDFAWGGYILYRMWPQEVVFIDGQTDFYGEVLFREYLEVISLNDNWQDILDKYDVAWLLIPTQDRMGQYLIANDQDEWTVLYQDDTAVILRRGP